jgi:DNA-directed RNA polymerase specialized sigma24 family protein
MPAMTFEEIAKAMRLPTATVFWIYKQAMKKLRMAASAE